jgi:dGTPase
LLNEADLPRERVEVLGSTSSERIGRMVTDVVLQTLEGGMTEIRMSERVLKATVGLRSFLFDAVYENEIATAEFGKAAGILGGLWQKLHERPAEFLDAKTVEHEGLDAAARDFLAGMTDRYAVNLYEQLFVPKPWVSLRGL